MANFKAGLSPPKIQEPSVLPRHALLPQPPLPMAGEELAGSTVVDDELGPGMDRVEAWPVSWACDQQNRTGPLAQEGPLFGV